MSSTSRRNRQDSDDEAWIALDEVNCPEKMRTKLLASDRGQIEKMRQRYELGLPMIPVILRPLCQGGYQIEDGRHRVVAALLAEQRFINALIG
jgi:hypothetical protein